MTTLNLRQQLILQRRDEVATKLGVANDSAFLHLAYSIVLNKGISDIDPIEVVEGGGDKHVDVISINGSADSAVIEILQVKNEKTFSSDAVVKLKMALTGSS